MTVTRDEILTSVRRRRARSGLLTADRYFRSIEACFDGRFCPTDLFARSTEKEWETALEEAACRLVYADPAAEVDRDSIKRAVNGDSRQTGGTAAVMDFEAVVTTTRRDRDRDIMESKGALVDPQAVLLWQHIPLQPIGRLLEVTEQTEARLKARLSIADTQLGRDAAVLLEFGALRISHGFEPLEFKPLRDAGWHFLKFEIYEISLVSVPSNKDAVVTAYDRRKLHSPLIKGWAAALCGGQSQPGIGWQPKSTTGASAAGNRADTDQTPDPAGAAPSTCTRTCARTCARFIARASRAGALDLNDLENTRAALEQIIDRLKLAPAAASVR